MKTNTLYQQGDVLIQKVDAIPQDAKPCDNARNGMNILAEGEVTGHYHGINCNSSVLLATKEAKYLDVKAATDVKHQEHNAITIPAGVYTVRQVQEYDHFEEIARNTRD